MTGTSDGGFDGVAVFSSTMVRDRDHIGERVTDWVRNHPEVRVVDAVVTQSSDSGFHCVTITLFWLKTSRQ